MSEQDLTPREREVLPEIISGATNRETGQKLGISPRTVEVHRARIMHKFGAKNVVDLMRITAEPSARLIAAKSELFAFADHPVMEWLLTDGINNIPEPQRTSVRLFLIPLRNAAIAKATGAAP
jgi:DNA-binding CsgD family transcriptional regulator